MKAALPQGCLDQIFREARTFSGWSDTPVGENVVRELYDLLKWGPTSANSSPARFVWVRSEQAKATLAGLALDKNREKILQAPLTVIVGNDFGFASELAKLMPRNAAAMQQAFAQPGMTVATARRNGTLQGGYLIIAARALGLDCGPMSGFDNAAVDREFFADTRIESNFICSIGYGDPASLFPVIRG